VVVGASTCQARWRGALLQAIEHRTLGKSSVARGQYLRNMQEARLYLHGRARWVEVCYCPTPLQFSTVQFSYKKSGHTGNNTSSWSKFRMRMTAGVSRSEPWSCENCDCTECLERKLALGDPFLKTIGGG